jgi:hypothetical protein
VDDPARREVAGGRRHGPADRQATAVVPGPQRAALRQDRRAALAVDRAVDAAAAEQRRVRGVDDRVHAFGGDVARDQFDSHDGQHGAGRAGAPPN